MFNRKIKKRKRQFVNSIIYIIKITAFMFKCTPRKSLDYGRKSKKGQQINFC